MTVAIHQPNFIPYMGFFEKMKACDLFVIMGNCQFEKGKYQNRFYHNGQWNTMSVGSGMIPILKKRYMKHEEDWARITSKYSRLKVFDHLISHGLWETNTGIIIKASIMMGIKTKIVFDYPTPLKSTERLVDICKHYGATTYLSGISGKHYLDQPMFHDSGIALEFQDEMKLDKRSLVEIL